MSRSADLVRSMMALRKETRTGVITIRTEGSATFVYLRDGVPVFAEEGTQGETLGRLLVRQGRLTQEQYVEIISKMTDALVLNEQLRFGEVAIELGYLSEEEVRKALGDQIRWKIVRTIQRLDAQWEFEDSVSRLDDVGFFPMQIESLVLDAVRWVDDVAKLELGLARALDQTLCVPPEAVKSLAEQFGMTTDESSFAARLDGTLTVDELLASTDADSVDGHAILTALIMTRVAVPADEARAAAAKAAPVPVPIADAARKPATIAADASGAAPERAPARVHNPFSHTAKILEALEARRVKANPQRDPETEHEARLLAERAFQSGLELMKSGRHEEAASELERALQLQPASTEYRLYFKWCRVRAQGELAHAADRNELRRLATAALAVDPNLAFAYYVAGDLALSSGLDKEARRVLKRATKLDPSLVDAERLLRIAERRKGSGEDNE